MWYGYFGRFEIKVFDINGLIGLKPHLKDVAVLGKLDYFIFCLNKILTKTIFPVFKTCGKSKFVVLKECGHNFFLHALVSDRALVFPLYISFDFSPFFFSSALQQSKVAAK